MIKNMHHISFDRAYECGAKETIEKACKWFKSYLSSHNSSLGLYKFEYEKMIADFKKAME